MANPSGSVTIEERARLKFPSSRTLRLITPPVRKEESTMGLSLACSTLTVTCLVSSVLLESRTVTFRSKNFSATAASSIPVALKSRSGITEVLTNRRSPVAESMLNKLVLPSEILQIKELVKSSSSDPVKVYILSTPSETGICELGREITGASFAFPTSTIKVVEANEPSESVTFTPTL